MRAGILETWSFLISINSTQRFCDSGWKGDNLLSSQGFVVKIIYCTNISFYSLFIPMLYFTCQQKIESHISTLIQIFKFFLWYKLISRLDFTFPISSCKLCFAWRFQTVEEPDSKVSAGSRGGSLWVSVFRLMFVDIIDWLCEESRQSSSHNKIRTSFVLSCTGPAPLQLGE